MTANDIDGRIHELQLQHRDYLDRLRVENPQLYLYTMDVDLQEAASRCVEIMETGRRRRGAVPSTPLALRWEWHEQFWQLYHLAHGCEKAPPFLPRPDIAEPSPVKQVRYNDYVATEQDARTWWTIYNYALHGLDKSKHRPFPGDRPSRPSVPQHQRQNISIPLSGGQQ